MSGGLRLMVDDYYPESTTTHINKNEMQEENILYLYNYISTKKEQSHNSKNSKTSIRIKMLHKKKRKLYITQENLIYKHKNLMCNYEVNS